MNWSVFLEAFPGVVLGGVFSGVVWLVLRMGKWVIDNRPINCLLAPYRQSDERCTIFCRFMRHEGRLLSPVPQYHPKQQAGATDDWVNIAEVVSAADMQAVTDIVGVLGRAGRIQNVEFVSAEVEWDQWDTPMIFSGGNRKVYALFDATPDSPVRYDRAAGSLRVGNAQFRAIEGRDYSVIWKTQYPPTGQWCLVFFGLGSLGTRAAARYFRTHAKLLGEVFGKGEFAVLLQVSLTQGGDSASPIWSSAVPTSFKTLHPLKWRQNVSKWDRLVEAQTRDHPPATSPHDITVLSSTNTSVVQSSTSSDWPSSTTAPPSP